MTVSTPTAPLGAAQTHAFAAALDAATFTDRFSSQMRAAHRQNMARLIETPAPDVAGLAAKLELADPMDLDHHAALSADARRLAALPLGLAVDDARELLAFIDAAQPGSPVPASVVVLADRLEAALAAGE